MWTTGSQSPATLVPRCLLLPLRKCFCYYLCYSEDVSLFHFLGNFPRNLFMREENDWTLFLGREGTLLRDRRFTQVCQVVRLPFQIETRMGQYWGKLWIPMTFYLQLNLMSTFWKQVWCLWYDTLVSLFVPFQSTFKFKEKKFSFLSTYHYCFCLHLVYGGWMAMHQRLGYQGSGFDTSSISNFLYTFLAHPSPFLPPSY